AKFPVLSRARSFPSPTPRFDPLRSPRSCPHPSPAKARSSTPDEIPPPSPAPTLVSPPSKALLPRATQPPQPSPPHPLSRVILQPPERGHSCLYSILRARRICIGPRRNVHGDHWYGAGIHDRDGVGIKPGHRRFKAGAQNCIQVK